MLFLNLDKIFQAISSGSEKKERSGRSGSSSSLAAVNKDFMFLFFFFYYFKGSTFDQLYFDHCPLYDARFEVFLPKFFAIVFFVLAFYLISLILIMVICQHFLIMVMYTAFFLSMGSYGKIT